MKFKVAFDGGAALNDALEQLKRSLVKPTMRRAAAKALRPALDMTKRLAPVAEREGGALRDSYVISTKLTPRERSRVRREKRSEVTVYMGTSNPAGLLQEFGTIDHPPQPHIRPAWSATRQQVLDGFAKDLATEIDRTAKRAAKRESKARDAAASEQGDRTDG